MKPEESTLRTAIGERIAERCRQARTPRNGAAVDRAYQDISSALDSVPEAELPRLLTGLLELELLHAPSTPRPLTVREHQGLNRAQRRARGERGPRRTRRFMADRRVAKALGRRLEEMMTVEPMLRGFSRQPHTNLEGGNND